MRTQAHGPSGQTEPWLMVKLAADRKQGDLNMLLKSGADPNVVVKVEWREFPTSPLLEASVSGHTRVARMLLSAGAEVNTAVGPGYTALYNAAYNGHVDAVNLLLEHGAEVDAVTDDHFTPLYIACQEGYHECVQQLLGSGADVNHARPDEGATALYIAAQNGHARCVQELLANGVLIDKPMHDGSTPLMIACYMQNTRVVELLLRAGASLHLVDNRNRSALDWAKRRGDALVVALVQEELAARGAAIIQGKASGFDFFARSLAGCVPGADACVPRIKKAADSTSTTSKAGGAAKGGRGPLANVNDAATASSKNGDGGICAALCKCCR